MVLDPAFDLTSWYRATTLAERAAALQRVAAPLEELPAKESVEHRRFKRWRAQKPFTDERLFRRRLAAEGLAEPTFRKLLGEPIENVARRAPGELAWLDALKRAQARPRSTDPLPLPKKFESVPTSGFLELVRPLIDDARSRVRDRAAELARVATEPVFDPATVDALLAQSLANPLLTMLMRTLVLELNVAKVQDQLAGDTPTARFGAFIERLCRPEVAMAIFVEYPVLARHLVRCIEQWVEVSCELLEQLVADAPALRALFSPDRELGPLVALDGNAGDTHRGGRAVAMVTFRSGLRLVYKPKSLAVDVHFQELLGWLNERGASPPFRTLKVLDRGHYGWMERVERAPCGSLEEVERFYARQGENLALLYALGATDFHFENLIAAGEHPVLVDLEALFHPRLVDEDPASLVQKESLFRTNLLPMRLGAGGDYAGMDISGLGSPEGQLTPQKVQDWDDRYSDTMRFVRRRVPMRGASNQPRLEAAAGAVDARAHLPALRTGFDAMYALLVREREALVAAGGPLDRFARDPMRLIMRDTRSYLLLLAEAFHPDALRDALEHDRILDHLWAVIPKAPHMLQFLPAERAAMARCDVPLFAMRPDSLEIEAQDGGRITGLIAVSGLEAAKQRLMRLDERDRARHRWCIEAAFASMAPEEAEAEACAAPAATIAAPDRPIRDQLLDAASAIGDRLATLAFVEGDLAGWHVVRQIDDRYWAIESAGMDLYGGLPGIALFLAQLARLTGDARHTELARRAATTMRRTAAATRETWDPLGAFTGWGGVLHTFARLAELLDDPALLDDAAAIVEHLPERIARDDQLDVIGGAAGCLLGLVSLHRAAPSPRTLAAAIACGDRLLATARGMERGVGWTTPIAPETPLCGLSHGAAGIAWALLELAAVTGEARFRAAAEQAFEYERGQLAASGTWPDLRPSRSDEESHVTAAWCHGAPGIGLSRLRALALGLDAAPALCEEVALALAATARDGFGHNHSLCHGDLGNLELWLLANTALPGAGTAAKLARHTSELLERAARGELRCATPQAIPTPGLMLGLAGIGYGLLRLADPAAVPSVLLLDLPGRAAGGSAGPR